MNGWVMICHGDAIGGHQEYVGWYLALFDPDVGHAGEVRWTPVLDEARFFASLETLIEVWQAQSLTVPLRPDGLPNRPLTAWSVEPRRV